MNTTVLQVTGTMQQSSRFFFICVFKGVLSSELVDQEQKNANGNQQKTRHEASKPPTTYFTTALNAPNFSSEFKKFGWMGVRLFAAVDVSFQDTPVVLLYHRKRWENQAGMHKQG